MNKLVICFLLIVISSLQFKLWFKADGMKGIIKINREITQQKLELNNLRARNQELANSIKLMKKNPKSVEEHARVIFGMIKKDETYYRIID